jgi:hypothetical protein
MTSARAWRPILLSGLLGVGSSACDGDFVAHEPAAVCVEAGAQCVLPSGPLGVCESSACSAGESPPCFVCTPQH